MKTSPVAVPLLATTLSGAVLGEECLSGGFRLDIDGTCNPRTVLAAYEEQVYYATGGIPTTCTTSAEEDLLTKLGDKTIQSLCDELYLSQEKVPFTNAAGRGDDFHFEEMFFNGRTDWQEDVETLVANAATDILKEDAEQVRVFFGGTAQGRRVEWPGTLTNFQSSVADKDGMATCTTNAAMCCWPKDRQANDNNGNCATPYDENCVNKDPADNTDLCFVDLNRASTDGYESDKGFLGFPQDNNDGEGAIHCHGLAWSNDVNDRTARYKANNLFFVSMYDHMYQRGYVKNIPGAPMCGCVEQMPTVTRSDCTQIDVVESFVIDYSSTSGNFTSKLTSVDVNFNACQGINNQNNNLWAYMARLYYQGDITPKQFGAAGRIITNGGCEGATLDQLNKMNLQTGYEADDSMWTRVAGRESMKRNDPYGQRAFNKTLTPGVSHYGIIFRACATCATSHQKIFYRRITPVPEAFILLYNILYETNDGGGRNRWGLDFSLHSTYEDAVNGTKPWLCPGGVFNYGATFYGECSPTGVRAVNQFSRFHENWGQKFDVGYFANKAEGDGLQVISTNAIKGYAYWDNNYGYQGAKTSGIALKDQADGNIYMTGGGMDIWNTQDDFNYHSQAVTGDYTAIVHADKLSGSGADVWAKAGLMFRKSIAPDSVHYSVYLTRASGICFQVRPVANGTTTHLGCVQTGIKSSWLMIRKSGNVFTAHVKSTGSEIWTQVNTYMNAAFAQAVGNNYNVGLAACSHEWDPKHVVEAVFSQYLVTPTTASSTALTRKVRVQLGGANWNYLHLREVEVWDQNGINRALNKNATQSSTMTGYPASSAVNGVVTGWSFSHTNGGASEWWDVDLGEDVSVAKVTIYNRVDCCSDRLSNSLVSLHDSQGMPLKSYAIGNAAGIPVLNISFAGN